MGPPDGIIDTTPPKINGFSRPFHTLQIISWWVFGYLNINFHVIFGACNDYLFILFNFIHFIISLISFISAYKATNANVVDPYVAERGFPEAKMSTTAFTKKYKDRLANKEIYWCKYCDWYVTPTSKHCRQCNKCVCDFDHHCKWLNNCVSNRNYKSFFAAVCFIELLFIYELLLGCLMITNKIDIISDHLLIDSSNSTIIYTLIIIQLFVATLMLIPLLQLLLFHLFLMKKQITTYDWVLERETQQKQKTNDEIERKCHKDIEMNKANKNQKNKKKIGRDSSSKYIQTNEFDKISIQRNKNKFICSYFKCEYKDKENIIIENQPSTICESKQNNPDDNVTGDSLESASIIVCCNGKNNKMKWGSNSVHVVSIEMQNEQKYSSENIINDIDEHDNVIFGSTQIDKHSDSQLERKHNQQL